MSFEYDIERMEVKIHRLESAIEGELGDLWEAFHWSDTPQKYDYWYRQAVGEGDLDTGALMDIWEQYKSQEWPLDGSGPDKEVTGGPSAYYDMPFSSWVTTNDMMEYLAENKWGKFGIHLKDIFKGVCRWGEKSGVSEEYDTKKIIYYGVRILRMLVGIKETRNYLQQLLDDEQFKEKD